MAWFFTDIIQDRAKDFFSYLKEKMNTRARIHKYFGKDVPLKAFSDWSIFDREDLK